MLPTIQEYKDSFRNPSEYFKTLTLASLPSKFDENEPYFIAGGFACVFKLEDQQNQFWAFKCFLQDDAHRNQRLEILSDFLKHRTENYFLPTHYYTDELWVCSNLCEDGEYPTLAMKWVEGLTLGEYVHKAAKDKNTQKLTAIYEAFLRLAHFLLSNDFAHGDLKHDNILVDKDENLILIDYDGMYLPSLTAFPSPELGGHGYQHPKRTAQDWGRHIDDFSILVILLSLRAYILLPSLIDDHKNENLLLTSEDLQNPMQSKPLQTLWQQNDEPLKHLLGMLLNSLAQNNLRVLEIGAFVERNKKQKRSNFSVELHKAAAQNFHINYWWSTLDSHKKNIFIKNNTVKNSDSFQIDSFEIMNLTKLDLNSLELTELPNWIGNLTNLIVLILNGNKLSSLPENIGNLINLIGLNLNNNQLTSLPERIGNLNNLTYLNLDNNQLVSLQTNICNLTNLKTLGLYNNRLTSLPNNIGNLSNLSELDLINNELTLLPESIGSLINLATLNLANSPLSSLSRSKNKLASLPESIGNLINLKELNLDNNQLMCLPESIGNLTNLEELSLFSNKITSLPKNLGNLTNLIDLSLSHNQLTLLPESIEDLKKLAYLCLDGNPLSNYDIEKIKELLPNCKVQKKFIFDMEWWNSIDIQWKSIFREAVKGNEYDINFFVKITNLTELHLKKKHITELPYWTGNLTNLTKLNLEENYLTELPNSIGNLTNLAALNLGNNQLTYLPESIGSLTNLEKLYLRSNRLTELPESIGNMTNLIECDLGANRIEKILNSMRNLRKLKILKLDKNVLSTYEQKRITEFFPNCDVQHR